MSDFQHQSVLLQETIDGLAIQADGWYVDATFGRGGHSRAILASLGLEGRLLVIDQDPEAIKVAQQLAKTDSRLSIAQGSFMDIARHVQAWAGKRKIQGIVFDLGVSSPQLDDGERGFSFQKDGPLDMRMNPEQGLSAAEFIQSATEAELSRVFWEYGEERYAKRISRAIVANRQQAPILRTLALADIVKAAHPAWEKHKHPATRVFQAIRLHVNQELLAIEQALPQTLELLAPGGRLVVIAFHSLEDRLVKRFMHQHAKGPVVPAAQRHLPLQTSFVPQLRLIGKKIKASEVEVQRNPRARSAVLRIAEKC